MQIEDVLEDVRIPYKSWSVFMEREVDFWKVEKDWHTKPHCSRVLLLSLILERFNHLDDTEQEALAMAAVFHDSRRQDDWLDVGHGQRAAYLAITQKIRACRRVNIVNRHETVYKNVTTGRRIIPAAFTMPGKAFRTRHFEA